MVATESHIVGKKRPSRSWRSESSRHPCRMNRAARQELMTTKKKMLRKYTTIPMVVNPGKV